jgi:Transposase IS116/IS110/IS902 family
MSRRSACSSDWSNSGAKSSASASASRMKLTQLLKDYFPQALDWAGEIEKVMACEFLSKWPTLEKLQKSKPETIRSFYREHGARRSHVIEEQLRQVRSALPLTTDEPVIETSTLMVKTIAPQLHLVVDAIAHFDERIKKLFQVHPDAHIFSSLPGAGPILAPRLLAAMGSDRSRFNSSEEVAKYSGIVPRPRSQP